jgi:predicted transcriptional regulator
MRARVDEAAEKLGLSRSAWISQAVSRQLDRES